MRIIYSLFLIFISLISPGVFGASTPDEWMSRAELTAQLSALRCEDCLTPSAEMITEFSADRLASAKKNPTLSLDDLTIDMYSGATTDYYYCVASIADAGIMNGFPRESTYCSGKFCGHSFVTTAELIQAVFRLVEPKLRSAYPIDRTAVATWAKDEKDLSIESRRSLIDVLKSCPTGLCPATNAEQFSTWISRCADDLDRCDLMPISDFPATHSLTVMWRILLQRGLFPTSSESWHRFQVLSRPEILSVLELVGPTVGCTPIRADRDADGLPDANDTCPSVYDADGSDSDHDGIGDVCDDDIDGDGVKNPVGIVDAPGYVITSLLTPTSDNCLFTPNSDQKNIDTTPLGDACTSTKISATSSPLQALQIAATPMRGPVPLTVLFTSDVVGSTQDLLRDFDTSELVGGAAPRYTFTTPGYHLVRATADFSGKKITSFLPIHVLPDAQLLVGLESTSRQLDADIGTILELKHIVAGEVQKLIWAVDQQRIAVDPKQTATLTIQRAGYHRVELQAYNKRGERVGLSQFSVEAGAHRGSHLHTSSLDPLVDTLVNFTTISYGFTPADIDSVTRDFGDSIETTQDLIARHQRKEPGVYLVKQTIAFRDPTRPSHENVLTVVVIRPDAGKTLSLQTPTISGDIHTPFTFTTTLDGMGVSSLKQCLRQFQGHPGVIVQPVTSASLSQRISYTMPGSYLISVMCVDDREVRYQAGLTIAVVGDDICLVAPETLRCDLDGDGIPDLCDDDIDGDTRKNRRGLLIQEAQDCKITSAVLDTPLMKAYHTAIADGAVFDNCPFVTNLPRTDTDRDGYGDTCDDTITPGGGGGGGGAGGGAGGGGAGGGGGGGGGAGDSDGDGVPDTSDGCGSTPQGAGGSNGCPSAPSEDSDPQNDQNPLVEVDTCTQCPCPEADYASSLWKGDRVRALLLDEGGSVIYRYTTPQVIDRNIPDEMVGGGSN